MPLFAPTQLAGLFASALAAVVFVVGLGTQQPAVWQPAAAAAVVLFAIGLRSVPGLRTYQYTAWIIATVVVAMIYPRPFALLSPDRADAPQNRWIMLAVIQLVMFGMATQMSLADFRGLGRMWYGVAVGTVLQFTIMPVLGFLLAKAAGFPPEIAAGVVLIGSCSSGLASNVMTYIARANLPLSIALSAVGTVLSPFITPLWMKLLAGEDVNAGYFQMMMTVVKIMVVPIGAALLHDHLKTAAPHWRRIVEALALAAGAWLAFIAFKGWPYITGQLHPTTAIVVGIVGYLAEAVLAGVVFHAIWRAVPQYAGRAPILSMWGIMFFTAITTATGRANLLNVGGLLLVVVAVHNAAGFVLGYALSKLCGLDEPSARTVTLEVGLQNGGLASGMAGEMGQLGTVGLAAAVFSPWMNVTGSLLANYWRRRPPRESQSDTIYEGGVP
jgi:BASS family bile acid:Na+ symporter